MVVLYKFSSSLVFLVFFISVSYLFQSFSTVFLPEAEFLLDLHVIKSEHTTGQYTN